MEGPFRRLLLVAGILAALLPAATATFGPQPGGPCEPTLLARQAALFCSDGHPAPLCCETVLTAVNSVGGVTCICRIAAEPQLVMAGVAATHLLGFYTTCAGLRPEDAHLAAAVCKDSGPQPAPSSKIFFPRQHHQHCSAQGGHESCHLQRKLVHSICEETSALLARRLLMSCGGTETSPSSICCSDVLRTIDSGCLCEVGEEPRITTSILDSDHMWFLYRSCGGKGTVPLDTGSCSLQHSPPPPPPNAPPPPPNPRPPPSPPSSPIESIRMPSLDSLHKLRHTLRLTSVCFGTAIVALCVGLIITAVVILKKNRANAAVATSRGELKVATPSPSRLSNMPCRLPEPAVALRPKSPDPAPPHSQLIPSQTPRRRCQDPAPPRPHLLPTPPQLQLPPAPTPSAPPEWLMAD